MSAYTDGFARIPPLIAVAASAIVVALLLFVWTIHPSPFVPIVLAVAPAAVVISLSRPFLMCLLFIVFTFFRIHEIYPALTPLHLPMIFSGLILLTLAWHFVVSRSLSPYLTPELTLFLAFFALVTIGIFFATDPASAGGQWSNGFWKIGIMTLAVAWLARNTDDFAWAGRLFMLSGLLIAMIAIDNMVAGIHLVDGSRVTIGTGVLHDPNMLAFALLFPISFSAATLIYREKLFDTVLALLTTPMIAVAIIATQSRGGLLGLFAVLIVIGLRWAKSKTRLLVLILAVPLSVYFVSDLGGRASHRNEESSRLVLDESSRTRLALWSEARGMAIARPFTGVGLGNFQINSSIFDPRDQKLGAHSIWFEVLAETGVPGLIVFVGLIIVSWIRITSSIGTLSELDAPASTRAMALALQAALLGFCVSGSFLDQAFNSSLYIYVALISAVCHYAHVRSRARET